jgi:glutamine synthetase
MVTIAKSQILPAAQAHQRRLAESVAATKAAGVNDADSAQALRELVDLVGEFRRRTAEVERLSAHHETNPARHAAQINRELKPAMARLRETGDSLETVVAADLWPLPVYRDLLFLK